MFHNILQCWVFLLRGMTWTNSVEGGSKFWNWVMCINQLCCISIQFSMRIMSLTFKMNFGGCRWFLQFVILLIFLKCRTPTFHNFDIIIQDNYLYFAQCEWCMHSFCMEYLLIVLCVSLSRVLSIQYTSLILKFRRNEIEAFWNCFKAEIICNSVHRFDRKGMTL